MGPEGRTHAAEQMDRYPSEGWSAAKKEEQSPQHSTAAGGAGVL